MKTTRTKSSNNRTTAKKHSPKISAVLDSTKKNKVKSNSSTTGVSRTTAQQKNLNQLFIYELDKMHHSENQIVKFLPFFINHVDSQDLKDALKTHLKETKEQVKRIEKIFSLLDAHPKGNICLAMEGILKESEKTIAQKNKSSLLDAAIIAGGQKIEHFEMAVYGALRSFAEHLSFDQEIIDLLEESFDEEAAADKLLTKIAVGTLFSSGINKAAAELTKV